MLNKFLIKLIGFFYFMTTKYIPTYIPILIRQMYEN